MTRRDKIRAVAKIIGQAATARAFCVTKQTVNHMIHPERHTARVLAHRAAKRGKIAKPTLCEGCYLDRPLTMHHFDYSKPLAVQWLCRKCHTVADKTKIRFA